MCLFLFISFFFSPSENTVVPEVLQALLGLQSNTHVALLYTSIELVGELSEWISKHPQYLGKA